jgi:succinate dehydrogenase / fumarate reductase cytochrome b subunit
MAKLPYHPCAHVTPAALAAKRERKTDQQCFRPIASALRRAPALATTACRRNTHGRIMTMAEIRSRPLSPHLQIYRPLLSMVMSITHRVTGAALYFGMILVAWWLIAAASGPNQYAWVQWFMGTIVGRLILFAYTWALMQHMLGGVRHLIWDTGRGLGPSEREWLVRASLFGSLALTLVLWIGGVLLVGGGGAR